MSTHHHHHEDWEKERTCTRPKKWALRERSGTGSSGADDVSSSTKNPSPTKWAVVRTVNANAATGSGCSVRKESSHLRPRPRFFEIGTCGTLCIFVLQSTSPYLYNEGRALHDSRNICLRNWTIGARSVGIGQLTTGSFGCT